MSVYQLSRACFNGMHDACDAKVIPCSCECHGLKMDGPTIAEGDIKMEKTNPEDEAMKAALTDWWLDRAAIEVAKVAPKAVEYSAIDLIEYGRTLALVMDLGHTVSDEEATEIGIWGYMVGKVARWTGAIKEGRRVSDDTIFDIDIYAKMAQRNRDVGGWPFGPDKEGK